MKSLSSLFLFGALLAGCGGGGASSSSSTPVSPRVGTATVTIEWPQVSPRLIPAATAAIRVQFFVGNATEPVASQQVSRPSGQSSSTLNFSNLPVGTLRAVAQAFASTTINANSVPLATRTDSNVVIRAGEVTPVTLTMASTVTSVVVAPTSSTLVLGGSPSTIQLTGTGRDSSNRSIPLGNVAWSSSDPSVAAVSSTGLVTARGTNNANSATATITFQDNESGRSGTATITVTATGGAGVIIN